MVRIPYVWKETIRQREATLTMKLSDARQARKKGRPPAVTRARSFSPTFGLSTLFLVSTCGGRGGRYFLPCCLSCAHRQPPSFPPRNKEEEAPSFLSPPLPIRLHRCPPHRKKKNFFSLLPPQAAPTDCYSVGVRRRLNDKKSGK